MSVEKMCQYIGSNCVVQIRSRNPNHKNIFGKQRKNLSLFLSLSHHNWPFSAYGPKSNLFFALIFKHIGYDAIIYTYIYIIKKGCNAGAHNNVYIAMKSAADIMFQIKKTPVSPKFLLNKSKFHLNLHQLI